MCWPPGGPWPLGGTLAGPWPLAGPLEGPLTPDGPCWPLVGSWLAGKAAWDKLWPLGGMLGGVWPGGRTLESGLGWPEPADPAAAFCGAAGSPGLK